MNLPEAIAAWMTEEVPTIDLERANAIGEEVAASWDEGDHAYQTVIDILGDYLLDDEPRPKHLADPLAEHFDLTLID